MRSARCSWRNFLSSGFRAGGFGALATFDGAGFAAGLATAVDLAVLVAALAAPDLPRAADFAGGVAFAVFAVARRAGAAAFAVRAEALLEGGLAALVGVALAVGLAAR